MYVVELQNNNINFNHTANFNLTKYSITVRIKDDKKTAVYRLTDSYQCFDEHTKARLLQIRTADDFNISIKIYVSKSW